MIPGYLHNRLRDVETIASAARQDDFPTVQRIAHNLKGSGSGYGFAQLSALGRELEKLAKARDRVRILERILELDRQIRAILQSLDTVSVP